MASFGHNNARGCAQSHTLAQPIVVQVVQVVSVADASRQQCRVLPARQPHRNLGKRQRIGWQSELEPLKNFVQTLEKISLIGKKRCKNPLLARTLTAYRHRISGAHLSNQLRKYFVCCSAELKRLVPSSSNVCTVAFGTMHRRQRPIVSLRLALFIFVKYLHQKTVAAILAAKSNGLTHRRPLHVPKIAPKVWSQLPAVIACHRLVQIRTLMA